MTNDKKLGLLLILVLSAVVNVLAFDSDLEIENANRDDEQPQVITGTVNVTAYAGDTATLPCEVVNLGNHHVNWLKIERDSPITLTVGYHQFSRNMRFRVARVNHHHHHHLFQQQQQRHQQQHKQPYQEESVAVVATDSTPTPLPPSLTARIESWNFEIRKVSPEDQGLYECYIKIDSRHKTKANVYLTVKSEKEKLANSKTGSLSSYYSNNYIFENPRSERLASSSIERIDLPPNNWVKLRCNATGVISLSSRSSNNNQPNYDLQWYKDDHLIEQDSRRLKKWVSSYDDSNYMELDIYAVEPEDSGLYQCRRDKTILKNVFLHVMGNHGSRSIVRADHLIALLFTNLVFLFATISV